MGRVKIVRIIARLNIGGPAVNASILSSSLDTSRFQTKALYGSLGAGEGNLEGLMRSQGVDMELIPELGREISLFDDIKAFFKIAGVLLREKPDIVHTHTAKAGTLGRLAAIVAGVKVKIHTFHGHVFRYYFSKPKTYLFIWIERFLGRFTTKVITVSEKQKDELVREFRIIPAGKCEVVPLAIETSRLTASGDAGSALREALGLGKSVVVGIMGRLVPIKNHAMLLEAAAAAKKARPELNIRYLVIGDGELREELEQRAAMLGVNDRVYFLGWRDDLAAVYGACDIVALTSKNEGTPLALIEAMAMAKPIIATNVGGVADIVDDGVNAMLVPSGDTEAFTAALIKLAEDADLRSRFGAAGAKKGKEFSKEKLVERTTKLYMDCLTNRKGS